MDGSSSLFHFSGVLIVRMETVCFPEAKQGRLHKINQGPSYDTIMASCSHSEDPEMDYLKQDNTIKESRKMVIAITAGWKKTLFYL